MHDDDKLSLDLVWQADGHLTEVAITALGDGEVALLPEGALAHAAQCQTCSSELGRSALLSLRVGDALREQAAEGARQVVRESAAPRGPLPLPAIGVALVLSALGAAPSLAAGAGGLHERWAALWHACSVVVRTGCAIAGSGALSGWLTALPWISAVLLVMVGLGVAVARGRQLSLNGGM
ncbi:uncharacterized protein SOCE26_089830 [Sorangium cellulosum]|uniref:Zinc-finger domain-containing protein n=1 Tax=Sorangium cellulosum TaxID=56 RepID=A0A2L0F7F8_SORCE|nr:hypothetical protein [Sorangium cellulosum]AUX47462.1 uncharacterized protein SOCE26_089830 [Sorangium cellulosum]